MTNPAQALARKLILLPLLMCAAFLPSLRAQSADSGLRGSDAPLSVDQVVEKLTQRNQERASALREFQGTRIYRMEYRGVPGDKDAEMTVEMSYRFPAKKEFTVVSKTGSKFILDHVFNKLLEGEQEAMQDENRQRTALNSKNYEFKLDRYETSPDGSSYVLDVLPKSKNKFLYVGKVWVDATDFAVTRIDAEPAKNPSFWIKKSEIKHRYVKVDGFWLPAENRSESQIRLGGRAVLLIEYKDYKIIQPAVSPTMASKGTSPDHSSSF